MPGRSRNTDAVWIDVVLSMANAGAELAKSAAGAGTQAGVALGVKIEQAAEKAGQQAGARLGSGLAAAEARVDQLGAALRDARDKEETAAGRVRVAEEKLNEVRAKGEKATGSQLAAAEEALAAARRKAASAADDSTRATKALESAQKDAAEATDDVAESTGQSDFGEYASRLSGAAKAAAGFAAAAVGVSTAVDLINTSIANSDINATLSAQLGATPEMAANFGSIAGDLFAKGYGENLQGVSDGLRAVYQSGAVAEDATNAQLESITGRAVNLQKTFSVDVAQAMRSVGILMRTGLAPDVDYALDLMTRGFQQGLNVADDLLETVSEYSTQFRKLGLDGTAAFGLISQGLKAGARDSDVVADALKEFSIRAIDGSAASSAAYKTLGLDADKTAQQIAQGGDTAAAGLQIVLDRLRGIQDPVIQAQAAVGLFGTKAEDLGAALYALDPSTAATAMGTVSGAAEKMGDTLAGTPAANLRTFGRELQAWGVDVLGGAVLPALMDTVTWLRDEFGPALMDTAQWIQRNQEWLIPLVVTLGTAAVTYKAVALVMDLWAKRTVILTAAQWALNAAQSANPVGLIIAAIVALVAGFATLWNTSEGFRNFWIGLWEKIQSAAVWVWESVLKPAFNDIVAGTKAVAAGAMWLWDNGIKPAFDFIAAAASWLWSTVLQPLFGFIDTGVRILAAIIITLFVTPAVLAFQLLAAGAMWLWDNGIKPAFDFIAAGAMWLWSTVLKPFVDLNVAAFQLLATAAMWLWDNGIKPAFDFIALGVTMLGDAFSWLWSSVLSPFIDFNIAAFQLLWSGAIKPTIDFIVLGVTMMGDAFAWVWNSLIRPAWNAFTSDLTWAYDTFIKPLFEGIKSGVGAVGTAFDTAVGFIGRIWDSLKSKLADPVNFLINFVYNDGIRAVWNKVADFVGVGQLPRVEPIRFAGGGVLAGFAPGVDSVPSLLSPGEAVLVPELVRAIGPATILAANAAASGRRGTVADGAGVARFAGGGVVGDLLGWVPGIGDDLKALWNDPRGWVASRLGGASGIANLIGAIPEKLIAGATTWLSEKVSGFFSSSGGGDLGKWIGAAMAFTGVPASWAGPLNTLIMRESGGNPRARNDWDINAINGVPSQGLMQTIPPTFAAFRDPRLPNDILDPIANIVAGINYIKSRYGSIFNVQQAVGSTPLGYDEGGYLPPGLQLTYNGTGRPERVLTDAQWEQLGNGGVRGGDGATINVFPRPEQSEESIGMATRRQLEIARRSR